MKTNLHSVSVIGLGKLGLPLALCFAHRSFDVVGYDIDKSWIGKLKKGKSPIMEPFTQELLEKHHKKLIFTQDPGEITEKSDITFIVVPTPSLKNGAFSSKYIEEVFYTLAPFIKKKKTKHTFVITSTISPKTTKNIIEPLIEKLTGKRVGVDLGLCYSPELIALGSVVQNIRFPDFLFIGESDETTGAFVEKMRTKICENKPQIIRTSWINAEIIKLALNAYITTKINFANMIARLSEKVDGADSEVILNAIGQDSRIGTKYLKGGLGFGGPCFPRDNLSLYAALKEAHLSIKLPLLTHKFNQEQAHYAYLLIRKFLTKKTTIGVLGLSYKPDTDVIEESQGVLIAKELMKMKSKTKVIVHDPYAFENIKRTVPKLYFVSDLETCINKADIIVIATQWDMYKKIDWSKYSNKTILDCWRIIDMSTNFSKMNNRIIQMGKYISLK